MKALDLLYEASPTLSVGVLTADLAHLGADLPKMEEAGVPMLHVDVMDGRFCPMMTVGVPFVQAMKTPLLTDVHLMIEEPLRHVDAFVAAGADVVTVHAESCTHVHRVLQHLGQLENANDRSRGIVRGVALNPGTSLTVLEPLMYDLDLILLLAVNPGWGGQSFIETTLARAAIAAEMVAAVGRDILVGVDGGIKKDNIGLLADTGVDIVVTGSAVYDGNTPVDNARFMLKELRTGRD